MSFFLRKINKPRWYNIPSWLPSGEPQADALLDLSTKGNSFSVFFVESDKSNLNQVVAAMAANCNYISPLAYAVIDEKVISSLRLKIVKTNGNTPDDRVNTNWHYDLIELSALNVLEIARKIVPKEVRSLISEKNIIKLITTAVQMGWIDLGSLKENVKKKVEISLKSAAKENS